MKRKIQIFFLPHRLVFETPPSPEVPKEPSLFDELDALEGKTPKPKPDETPKSKENLEALRLETQEKIESEGEAKDYAKEFADHRQLGGLALAIEFMNKADIQSIHNYKLWVQQAETNPDAIAFLFEGQGIPDSMQIPFPRGKRGRRKFIEGLKKGPNPSLGSQEEKDWNESKAALAEIVTHIDEYMQFRHTSGASLDAVKAKLDKPLGDTLGNALDSLKTSFKREKDWVGKSKIILEIGIVAWLAWQHADEAIPGFKNFTWKKLFGWAAGILLIDDLSKHITKDKRKLSQRLLEIKPAIDDLQDEKHPARAFAFEYGMKEDQEKWRTLQFLYDQKLSVLYPLYHAQKMRTDISESQKTIDPKALDLPTTDVNGHFIYEIIDNIVDATAKHENQMRQEEKNTAKATNVPFLGEEPIDIKTDTGEVLRTFYEKYVNPGGDIGRRSPNLLDAIVTEYPGEVAGPISKSDIEGRITPPSYIEARRRVIKRGGQLRNEYKKLKIEWKGKGELELHQAALEGLKVGAEGVKKAALFVWGEGLKPAAEVTAYAASRYLINPLFDETQKRFASKHDGELSGVLPADFNPRVIDPQINATQDGKARVMGFPVVYGTSGETSGKYEIVIEGKKFDRDLGASGANAALGAELKQSIEKKVSDLVASKVKGTPLAGKPIEWDPSYTNHRGVREGRWLVKDVAVDGNRALDLPKADVAVAFTIDNDAKTIRFSLNDKEVPENFKNLDRIYRDAEIQKQIWENPLFGEHLKGLPVKVESVKANSRHGAVIKGTIAGLEFYAIPLKNPHGEFIGINFCDKDAKNVNTTGASVRIVEATGGGEFLNTLRAKIDQDPVFNNAWERLQAQMDNVPEGVWKRLNILASKTWWILPREWRGAINGEIKNKLWKTTLAFKRDEALAMFTESLDGETVDNLNTIYTDKIEHTIKRVTELAQHIDSLTPERKAEKFGDILSGEPKPGLDGLERINYLSPDYRQLFRQYQNMIKGYKYEGMEDLDILSNSAYDIYYTLMSVWSYRTREWAYDSSLTPGDQSIIKLECIDRVAANLTRVQGRDGKISIDGLRKSGLLPGKGQATDADYFEKWTAP